jgi:hypothetical protein
MFTKKTVLLLAILFIAFIAFFYGQPKPTSDEALSSANVIICPGDSVKNKFENNDYTQTLYLCGTNEQVVVVYHLVGDTTSMAMIKNNFPTLSVIKSITLLK